MSLNKKSKSQYWVIPYLLLNWLEELMSLKDWKKNVQEKEWKYWKQIYFPMRNLGFYFWGLISLFNDISIFGGY